MWSTNSKQTIPILTLEFSFDGNDRQPGFVTVMYAICLSRMFPQLGNWFTLILEVGVGTRKVKRSNVVILVEGAKQVWVGASSRRKD